MKRTFDMSEIQYSKPCPQCKRVTVYKNRQSWRQSVRENLLCKACSHIPSTEKRQTELKNFWTPIIGYWPSNYRTFVMIRTHWNSLTTEQQNKILQKTNQQKLWYWGHLRRWNRNANHRRCRATMAVKYAGDNHWMKRPEVLAKVKKSCEKYKGDNHWFRRGKTTIA